MRPATARSFLPLILTLQVVHASATEAEPVTPEAFLADAEGRTVHYTKDGAHYGTERFYGNGRATWQFPGATCEDGRYWVANDEICFRYDTVSCWAVVEGGDRKRVAVSRSGFSVIIDKIDDTPLRCDGIPLS